MMINEGRIGVSHARCDTTGRGIGVLEDGCMTAVLTFAGRDGPGADADSEYDPSTVGHGAPGVGVMLRAM
jgi:hypothetical protein